MVNTNQRPCRGYPQPIVQFILGGFTAQWLGSRLDASRQNEKKRKSDFFTWRENSGYGPGRYTKHFLLLLACAGRLFYSFAFSAGVKVLRQMIARIFHS